MQQYKTIAQIKSSARETLPGNYLTAISAALLSDGLYLMLLLLTTPAATSTFAAVLSYIMYFILQLLMGILDAGNAFLYMNIVYKQPAAVGDIFHNFREQPDKAIRLQLVFVLIGSACYLPMYAYSLLSGDAYRVSVRLLLMALGFLAAFLIRLRFSQVFYLLQDFPERGTLQILNASTRLMRGQILRLILLTLSFLPLFLVSIVTFFLPLLWLSAYYRASLAAFYSDLMAARSR